MLLDHGKGANENTGANDSKRTNDGKSSKSGASSGAELLTKEAVERILTPRSVMTELGSDTPFPTGYRGVTPWYGEMSVLHLPTTPAPGASGGSPASAIPAAKSGADANAAPAAKPVVIGHSGSDGTNVWAFLDRDLIIFYFTQSRGGLTPIRLETEIDRLLLHPGAPEPAPERFAPYLARYHAGYLEVGIVVQNGHLAFDSPDSLVFELSEPADGRSWNAKTGGFSVVFERAPAAAAAAGAAKGVADAAVTGLEVRVGANARKYTVGAAPPEPKVDAVKLAALAGEWRDDTTQRIHRIVVEGHRLAVVLATKPAELTLFAPDEKSWWSLLSDPSLSIHFDFASDGTATSATSRLESPERSWTKVAPKAGEH